MASCAPYKDMRLRTGGSACEPEREREQRYAREQRPRAVDVPRAGRGREAHDPCTRPRVRPRCTAAAAVYRGERRVPLFSPACVPDLFNCELALSGSGSSYSSFGPDIFTFTPRAPRSFFICGRRRNSDDATRAAPIRGAVVVSSAAVGWSDRSFRQLLSTQSGLRDQ